MLGRGPPAAVILMSLLVDLRAQPPSQRPQIASGTGSAVRLNTSTVSMHDWDPLLQRWPTWRASLEAARGSWLHAKGRPRSRHAGLLLHRPSVCQCWMLSLRSHTCRIEMVEIAQ